MLITKTLLRGMFPCKHLTPTELEKEPKEVLELLLGKDTGLVVGKYSYYAWRGYDAPEESEPWRY
jgi:hypothetical protein